MSVLLRVKSKRARRCKRSVSINVTGGAAEEDGRDADGDRLFVYTYNTGKMTVIITLAARRRRPTHHLPTLPLPSELHCYISSRLEKA